MTCSVVAKTWCLGASSLDVLTRQSAAYVAGYVTRKVLAEGSPGKLSPFLRMSNRPGIGASAMWDVASALMQYGLERRRLPYSLGSLPLGRFLRGKLAVMCDGAIDQEKSSAMQAVSDYAWVHGVSQKGVFREINEAYASQLYQREILKRGAL